MNSNRLLYKDFVFKFDIVSLNDTSDVDYCHDFLDALVDFKIHEKYQFIFPLFYDFSITKASENGEDIILSGKKKGSYYWLINESIEDDIKKHSSYGLGITDSYCKSIIGPSYLEMTKESENTIRVSANIYNKLSEAYNEAFLSISEDSSKLNGRRAKPTTSTRIEFAKRETLDNINVIFDNNNDSVFLPLEMNPNFINGIKSHFPVFNHGIKYLYYFFTNNLLLPNNEKKGFGGLFVISDEKLNEGEIGFFILSGYTLANKMAFNQMWLSARIESIKSAKSAIMSRNMSHNLGSHVMSYLKQHLGSVKDMINDHVLAELINGELDLTSSLDKKVETVALPFLLGLGHFISYLQERQDFIATIATDYIPYYSTISFKDDIYDVLNPDKRAERHPERDKTSNMKMDNILLGNIARSEGLGRLTNPTQERYSMDVEAEKLGDIVLRYGTSFDGNPVKPQSKAEDDLIEMRNFNFSLPGGIVGRQAVFSILENIIRNSAKHGNWRNSGRLQLTFNIYDRTSVIPANDNDIDDLSLREVLQKFYFNSKDKDDLYYITITDNCEVNEDDLANLRIAIQDDYVDASGIMKDGNKGLKEMRISSAWIRSLRDEAQCFSPFPKYKENDSNKETVANDLKHDKNWIALTEEMQMIAPLLYVRIRAVRIGDNVKNRNLQYIFCIPKPKKVAIISDEILDGKVKDRLNNYCWRFFSKQEFEEEFNKSFEFIICDDKSNPHIYEEIRPIASSRAMRLSQIENFDRELFFNDLNNLAFDEKVYKHKLSSYENLLYEHLSDFVEGDIITIEDDRAKDMLSNNVDIQEDIIRKGNILISGTPHEGKYIYRTHHEAYKLFEKFMQSDYSSTLFVEGISGNNSTDRLIRNEEKNNIWFCRHLHAIKQQIAVFDERIFSRIGLKTADGFSKDHIATTYIQRGIYVFTLVQDKNDEHNSFSLYGVSLCNDRPTLNEKYACFCCRLATFTYNTEQGLQIAPTIRGAYMLNKFDYITIHQGLLDKMYDSFNIKKLVTKEEANHEKKRITNQLSLYFGKRSHHEIQNCNEWEERIRKGNIESWKDGFVPGFIIHSGRSKPGTDDMPQKLPFLQYAAIEHAVLDCKYSLVELLDYARYEK